MQQVVLAVLAVLILDMGEAARGMGAVMIGYWTGIVIILIRRPLSPTKGDLFFVRWGCSLLATTLVFAYLVRAVLF